MYRFWLEYSEWQIDTSADWLKYQIDIPSDVQTCTEFGWSTENGRSIHLPIHSETKLRFQQIGLFFVMMIHYEPQNCGL